MPKQIMAVAIWLLCFCLRAEAKEWTVWIDDGKSDPITIKDYQPSTNLLDGYFDALKTICDWNVKDYRHPNSPEERAPYARDKITVTPIGKWEGYEVFEYAAKDVAQKSIVLKDNTERYWIIYAIFRLSGVASAPLPAILTVDNQSVLAYETEVTRNAHYEVRYYYIYDRLFHKPRAIDELPIKKAAEDAIPTGCRIAAMQTDHLDIRGLRYSCLVGRSTHERHASGGKVQMDLRLKGGAFLPVNVQFIPPSEQ